LLHNALFTAHISMCCIIIYAGHMYFMALLMPAIADGWAQ